MKLQFDGSQPYQLDAIQSVISVFEGQPINQGEFQVSLASKTPGLMFSGKGVANHLEITEAQILQNVQAIQKRHGIDVSNQLERVKLDNEDELTRLNFTVEMETGTGKTYTYLRTIYELNKFYGFKKFVIVVPSVAIREGTVKNLEITYEHFQNLYAHPSVDFNLYDSAKLGALRNYAASNAIQILVINIDSFAKDSNLINTITETGIKPIEYIQVTNPFVIVDEPQNMETDIRKIAIDNLNPLCTLRYSATHKDLYNLLYSLNPVQAYDLGLVKQIEVDGVTADDNYNAGFVELNAIKQGKKTMKAKLTFYVESATSVKQKTINVDVGKDLYELSGGRETYKNGYILNGINADQEQVEFSGGLILKLGQTQGGLTNEVARFQLERTIKWHFEKTKKLKNEGIKVLSLIFIDRVSNYRSYDNHDNPEKGRFALWFEQLFAEYAAKPEYKDLIPYSVDEVHGGYFSQDKKGKLKDTKGNSDADRDTYSLIMKKKEVLLDPLEPLQFIFSHSALREGWDNPNVFQICTLNETKSEMKKRQEIGRGLRLPVNADGNRIQDKAINILTVVANETYESFSKALQREIETETSVKFEGRIKNVRDKRQVTLTKEITRETCPLFFEIWDKIKQRTRYRVEFSTKDVITRTTQKLKDVNQFPRAKKPQLEAKTVTLSYQKTGIQGKLSDIRRTTASLDPYEVPDVYAYVQSHVDISRYTIHEVLTGSGRVDEILVNPQMFLDHVVSALKQTLNELLVEGIKYEKINGREYEMTLFQAEEVEAYLSSLFEVSRPEKTLYNYVPFQSSYEHNFARDCEADGQVKFFFKLPRGFKIPTPVGTYNPDWAVVFEADQRIYFVVETKGALDKQKLREVEKLKIQCGEKHFAVLNVPTLTYKLAVTSKDLY